MEANTIRCSTIRPSFSVRVAIVLFLLFLLRFVPGCKPQVFEMNYNSLRVFGIDNSGEFIGMEEVEEMYASAVAFKLVLADSTKMWADSKSQSTHSFSFSSAIALSLSIEYRPNPKVMEIRVTTLLDIDKNIKAGDDFSSHIVYYSKFGSPLYMSMARAVDRLNKVFDIPEGWVYLIVKPTIQNTHAKFLVEIEFEDFSILQTETKLISIITP